MAGNAPEVIWSAVTVQVDGKTLVDNVDLAVAGGAWLALLGPNGAGKTTLLRTLARSMAHTGTVRVGGADTAADSARELAQRIAVVPQHPVIPVGVSVFDYALLGRAPHQGLRYSASQHDRQLTWDVLQRLELDGFGHRAVSTLSGGERQRVVLARAIAQEAPVLVLDEPTAFLDAGHELDVLELIEELRHERPLTVVSTLHDLSFAGQFADQVAVLSKGKLVASGTPSEALTTEIINEHWGVDAAVTMDDHGAVFVSIQRRRKTAPDLAASARSQHESQLEKKDQ